MVARNIFVVIAVLFVVISVALFIDSTVSMVDIAACFCFGVLAAALALVLHALPNRHSKGKDLVDILDSEEL